MIFEAIEPQSKGKHLPSESPQAVTSGMPMPLSERMPSGFGISSFNFGILALLIAWVPFIGLLGIPLSIIGLLMGVVGIILSVKLKRTNIGFSVTGTSLSAVALILAIYSTTKATTSITDGLSNLFDTSQNASSIDESSAVNTEGDRKKEIQWQSALNDITHDNINLRLTSCRIGTVALKDISGDQGVSKEKLLSLGISLTNLSETSKMTYQTWAGSGFSISKDHATVTDNFGNVYRRIDFGFSNDVIGSTKTGSIYPGKSLTDVLIFEKPIDRIENLRLELPASNFGGTGTVYVEIPKSLIKNLN